jgi:hypothetical protein
MKPTNTKGVGRVYNNNTQKDETLMVNILEKI